MNKTVTITAAAMVAGLTAGCQTAGTQDAAPAHSPASPESPASPAPQGPGQPGDTFTVADGADRYQVTLLSFQQPAQPSDEYSSAPAGHHLAAAEFRVTAVTKTDENANNSATATGSDEQAYTASTLPVAAGTNFASGRVLLQPGASLVGWVSFELPDGAQVAKVSWVPASGFGAHSAEWQVHGSAASPGAPPAPASPTASPTSPQPTATSPGTAAPPAPSGPEQVVLAYFDAINRRDFRTAWDLGGKNTTSSYDDYVAGYHTTAMVSADILDLSGDPGGAVVTARLTALQTDGTTRHFQGTYTVVGNVITEFHVRQVS